MEAYIRHFEQNANSHEIYIFRYFELDIIEYIGYIIT